MRRPFLAFAPLLSWAIAQPAPADIDPAPGLPRLTQADVDTWLDGFMPYALYQGDIAGAVVVVVKDGEVLTQRGFGYADVAKRVPVDPETTLFRPGSVSKLFTWTAVMQLVEQGKIDLDADVNQYLDFKIPPRDGKPVTMRQIMTHTAGFEEQAWNLMADHKEDLLLLGEHLARWVPERIHEAGKVPAYSNYASALAGYIVARSSGMSFDDYIDERVFGPLGMRRSSFRQPLPENLAPLLSRGYALGSGEPKGFEYVGVWPAGSLSSSGADMARFMIAHLQDGRLGEAQILAPGTARLMHEAALTVLPHMNRMTLGFYEQNHNGHRTIGHGGDTQWFHSALHLFIDDGVGLYVSMNSAGKDGVTGSLRTQLFEQFADRYFPGPTPGDAPGVELDPGTVAAHTQAIVGRYASSRRPDSSFLSLAGLFDKTQVIDNGDGSISVASLKRPSGAPIKWREIAPWLWRREGGKDLLSVQIEEGRVVRFSFGKIAPIVTFERVPPLKSPGWMLPATVLALVALLLTALAWPIGALVRRHYGVRAPLVGAEARLQRAVRLASLLGAILTIAWLVTFSKLMAQLPRLGRSDELIHFLQFLSPFAYIGGAAIGLWYAWKTLSGRRSRWAKAWSVVLALSFLVLAWLAVSYHLLSWGTRF